jgi:hypothetical protein
MIQSTLNWQIQFAALIQTCRSPELSVQVEISPFLPDSEKAG